jgi:hypothetical protein
MVLMKVAMPLRVMVQVRAESCGCVAPYFSGVLSCLGVIGWRIERRPASFLDSIDLSGGFP